MRRGATPAAGNGSQGRRERILEAAAQVFRKQGYDASMDDIAAEADVAKQTLYNQFGSKEDLFRALVTDRSRALRVPPQCGRSSHPWPRNNEAKALSGGRCPGSRSSHLVEPYAARPHGLPPGPWPNPRWLPPTGGRRQRQLPPPS